MSALDQVRAADCQVLYMHTGMTFGMPSPDLSRQAILECLHELVLRLQIPSVCLPSFTFSFCNGEDFDVQRSRCRMGAFNEYIRRQPGTMRSGDPLMSTLLVGKDLDLVTRLGKNSVGEGSTFHKLHLRGRDVRFLFFGTTASECFTYTHYAEERLGVPYRYRRAFRGKISDRGHTWEDEYQLYVRYYGVVPATDRKLEQTLYAQGQLRRVACGDGFISCVSEPDAYATICDQLRADIHAYIAQDPMDGNRTFEALRMVAL
jgi:aminoglycoside 3-N-acetyltransferase